MKVLVAQSCPTLCDPTDCSLPASSIHGIFQARILDGQPFTSSGDLPNPGIEPRSPASQADFFLLSEPLGKTYKYIYRSTYCITVVVKSLQGNTALEDPGSLFWEVYSFQSGCILIFLGISCIRFYEFQMILKVLGY